MLFQHKPRHIIFLIHGIGGSRKHFGYMPKALRDILQKKDPATKYLVRCIEYDTGHDEKEPYQFAQDIDPIIRAETESGRFHEKDKISLIMHSQGGLIGSIWMLQSLMETPGFSPRSTIEKLDCFITLGSPFWGAKTAQWGREMRKLTDQMGINIPLPFGRAQLEEMSFGSDLVFDFRIAMLDPKYQEPMAFLKNHVRFLNVVGAANLLNPLGIFVSGTDQYEDDGAVPLSSARFNFLYTQSLKHNYDEGDRTLLEEVKEIDMAPYVVVNAMHVSPFPEIENFAGISQIPKACLGHQSCQHPTFPYLWQHLLGQPVEQMNDQLGGFKAFLLDINVRILSDRSYSCEDIQVEVLKLDGSPLKNANVQVGKFYELYAQGKKEIDEIS